MTTEEKYEVYKFIISEIARQTEQSIEDFGLLKRMKLLFLFCTLSGEKRSFYYGSIFNNFHAQYLGPTEITIYKMAKLDDKPNEVGFIEDSLKHDIINQISNFKPKYKNIFIKKGIDLVQETYYFLSWQIAYNKAVMKDKKTEKIDLEFLIKENLPI